VVTAAPILRNPHATIQRGWLAEGAFASLVDFDSYWHPDAMREAAKFCTDDVPQLEYYRGLGYFRDIRRSMPSLGVGHRKKAGTGKRTGADYRLQPRRGAGRSCDSTADLRAGSGARNWNVVAAVVA